MPSLTFFVPVRTRFAGLVADMSPRDRNLFLGLIVSAGLAVLGGAAWGGKSLLADLNSRIATKQAALAQLEEMEAEYAANAAKVVEIEATLRQNANQDLPSYVEKAAAKHGLTSNLKAVREKGVSNQGTLEVKSYTVELDKVSLGQLTDFLFEVETNGFPMRIRSSRMKASGAAGTRVLSATFEANAYSLNEPPPLALTPGESK